MDHIIHFLRKLSDRKFQNIRDQKLQIPTVSTAEDPSGFLFIAHTGDHLHRFLFFSRRIGL